MKTKLLFASLFLGTLLSANAQTTSFEFEEGFATGLLNNQNGWTIAGATMPAANVSIVDTDASAGANSLQVIGTNTQSQTLIGVYSPDYAITGSQVTVSQDVLIPALGGSDTYIDALDVEGVDLYLTSRVIFDWQGNVVILEGIVNGAASYVNHGTYTAGEWMTLTVNYDFTANTIDYLINGTSIYSGAVYNGIQTDRLAFRYDNYNTGYSIDNVQIGATTLGVKENALASQFAVYPNPTNDVINVSNKNTKITGVSLTDLNGRTVKQASFDSLSNVSVNIADLSAGVYMMNIKSADGQATKKIVKN